jgi:rubredoxin
MALAVWTREPRGTWNDLTTAPVRTWMCLICGWIYDEAAGLPEEGIAAGTRWEDLPPNWTCPECGARKEDFELVEV